MSEDPAVAAVEQLLRASRRREPDRDERVKANFALWICACDSDDDAAPTWLVYDRAEDGRIGWCRVPSGTESLDLVQAKGTAGDHTSAADVLAWLQRVEATPWVSAHGGGDSAVLETLRQEILAD